MDQRTAIAFQIKSKASDQENPHFEYEKGFVVRKMSDVDVVDFEDVVSGHDCAVDAGGASRNQSGDD